MRGITHAAMGAAGAIAADALLSGVNVPAAGIAAAIAGSLLPDMDHPGSLLSRKVTLIFKGSRIGMMLSGAILSASGFYLSPVCVGLGLSLVLVAVLPHRGVTHSLAGLFAAGALAWAFGGRLAAPFMIGYGTHLLADVLTGGIPLFWPRETRVALFRAKTGGLIDYICLLLCIGMIIYCVIDHLFLFYKEVINEWTR